MSVLQKGWVRALLVVSVALNLLIFGMIAGWIISPDGPRGDRRIERPAYGVLGAPFIGALSREDRQIVVDELRDMAPRLSENRQALRARLTELNAALRADAFDRATIEALLDAQRETALARQRVGERLLLDRLQTMTADERRAFADRLERGLKRRTRLRD